SSGRKSWGSILLAGFAAGLGFYTYIAYRIFPLVCIALLLDRNIRRQLRIQLGPLAAAAMIGAIVVAPLALFYMKNPSGLTDRMERTALWNKTTEPLPVLLFKSTRDTIGMFTYAGDPNPRHNVPGEPALPPFSTAFFWIGMLFLLANVR